MMNSALISSSIITGHTRHGGEHRQRGVQRALPEGRGGCHGRGAETVTTHSPGARDHRLRGHLQCAGRHEEPAAARPSS